jgi:glycosyltransferase involved in cell wall biosynthesis
MGATLNAGRVPGTPRVSALMPVHNAERYVAEAITSILQQTFTDFELIVIDDGSSDRSGDILESFAEKDPRVIVHHQSNSGLVASLNRACSLARGTYIARSDADDLNLPQRFEKQVEYLDRHSDIGLLGTWIQDIGPDGKPGPVWPLPTTPAAIGWFLMFGNCVAHPSVMARRRLIQTLGYRAEATHIEDYDLWIRISAVSNLANLPEVLVKYRVLNDSVSSRNLLVQRDKASKAGRRLMAELMNSDDTSVQVLTKDLLLKLYSAYRAKTSLSRGDESEIVMDIFRRLYLSGEISTTWGPLLHLVPKLLSLQTVRNVLRYGTSYAMNIRHGFTTQRRFSV